MENVDLNQIVHGTQTNNDLTTIYQEVSPDRIDILRDRILKVACPGCLSGVPEYFRQKGSDNPFLHKAIPSISDVLKSGMDKGALRNVKHTIKR